MSQVRIGDGEGAYLRTFVYDSLTINEDRTTLTLVATREAREFEMSTGTPLDGLIEDAG